jgi:hypothetical protein
MIAWLVTFGRKRDALKKSRPQLRVQYDCKEQCYGDLQQDSAEAHYQRIYDRIPPRRILEGPDIIVQAREFGSIDAVILCKAENEDTDQRVYAKYQE